MNLVQLDKNEMLPKTHINDEIKLPPITGENDMPLRCQHVLGIQLRLCPPRYREGWNAVHIFKKPLEG